MKTVIIKFEMLSWWHAGSGMGQGGAADSLVVRDAEGLPYLPGKTVKGLLRDAVQLAEDFDQYNAKGQTTRLFGAADPTTLRPAGINTPSERVESEPPGRAGGLLGVDNALLPENIAGWVRKNAGDRKPTLFDAFASTALNKDGVAKHGTLRIAEVCPPLVLFGKIEGPDDDEWVGLLKKCVPLIRNLGKQRHRGLGSCDVTIEKSEEIPGATACPAANCSMPALGEECLWLEITLTSDVIFSASGATTGGHDSLDYLPGSALLGAAVGKHGFEADLFLSGKVRFGDGLPLFSDGRIGWPMPLNFNCHKKNRRHG